MKKIYYIANARMPTERAHGIQLAKMCEAFLLAGAELELVLPDRATMPQSLKNYYGLVRDIPVKRLPALDFFAHGRIGFVLSSITFIISYFTYLFAKKVRGEDFVVYTIDMDQFSFCAVPWIGVPYFAEIHDAKEPTFFFSRLFRKASGVVVINSLIQKVLMERFRLPADRIAVHPNGIDLSFFKRSEPQTELRKKLGLPADKKIVLYAGKFYDWKGLEILPAAAEFLLSDTVMYVVGGDKAEFESFTHRPTPANLACAGSRPYTDMPDWFAAADVLVVLGTIKNAYSYSHTSPMKLFEYMAAGRPIVAADTPAIREIAGSHELFFYEPDSPQSLASAVSAALFDPSGHEKVASAYERVRGYSWLDRAKSVLTFIQNR